MDYKKMPFRSTNFITLHGLMHNLDSGRMCVMRDFVSNLSFYTVYQNYKKMTFRSTNFITLHGLNCTMYMIHTRILISF